MEKGYKESHYNGRRQCDGIRVKDVADIYRDINGLRKDTDLKERLVRRDRTNKILVLIIIGLVDVIFGGGHMDKFSPHR